jgi:hypothetical protein
MYMQEKLFLVVMESINSVLVTVATPDITGRECKKKCEQMF